MTNIDQQTHRRITKTGITVLDKELAQPGFTLFAPMYATGQVYLLDFEGNEVHKWDLPFPPGLYGYLLPNGNLFYNGKVKDETWDLFKHWNLFKGGVILEVDWQGNIIWQHTDRYHHHDARRTSSGGAIYLSVECVPSDVATRVRGGIPGSDENGMWADVIVEVDRDGKRVWEWHAYEHLDFDTDVITFNDTREEWSHANTIVPLPEDKVLVSFRHISTVGIIDKGSGDFLWKLGYDVLAQQHDPNMLPNGNILLFDNGAHRKYEAMPASRVIEVDPRTDDIVWEYRDKPDFNFFSPYISGARRLQNGNTLITEGNFGRIFQVTGEGQIVWEYINPYYHQSPDGVSSNSVFRATHYQLDEIPSLIQR